MCRFRDQTKVRSCLWRFNTFYQNPLIILWYLFLSRYHFACGIDTLSVDVSRSFVEKHILFIKACSKGTDHSIPFVYIKQGFDVVQNTTYFKNSNGKNTRKRHLFLVTSNIEGTKEDLKRTFSKKVINGTMRVKEKYDFVVYSISLQRIRGHAVDAFDLDIKFDTMNSNYSIKDCKHSNRGTFNLGAKVDWGIRDFQINHVENVALEDSKPCKDYFLQNPPDTCRT